MAVNAGQHRTVVDTVDETDEGGSINHRWSCMCRRTGRWTTDKEAAEKAGRAHESRFKPKPTGPAAVRKVLTLRW